MCAFFQIRSDRNPNLLAAPLATVHKHKKTDCGLLQSGFVGWGIGFVGWGVGFAFRSFPVV